MFRIGAGSTLFAVNAGVVTATGGIKIGEISGVGVAATVSKRMVTLHLQVSSQLLTLSVMVKD